jgi:hypothetical protein
MQETGLESYQHSSAFQIQTHQTRHQTQTRIFQQQPRTKCSTKRSKNENENEDNHNVTPSPASAPLACSSRKSPPVESTNASNAGHTTTVLATAFPVSWPLAVPAETSTTAALEAGIFHVPPPAPVIVSGISTTVIATQPLPRPLSKKARGERGVDAVPRKQRTCYLCSRGILPSWIRPFSTTCPGSYNRKNCLYFDETGNTKWPS